MTARSRALGIIWMFLRYLKHILIDVVVMGTLCNDVGRSLKIWQCFI